jgi:hypothetical protein
MTTDSLRLRIDRELRLCRELEESARLIQQKANLRRRRAQKLGRKLSELQTQTFKFEQ